MAFILVRIFLFTAILGSGPTLGTESRKRTLAVASLDWPPYSSPELKGEGYVAEIVRRVFQEAGYEIQTRFLPWPRVLRDLEKGAVDLAMVAYTTREREARFYVSKPYDHAPLGFFKLKNRDIRFSKVEDLKPYVIGVGRNFAHSPEFDEASYLKKEEVATAEQNFLKLIAGRVDLVACDRANGFYVIQNMMASEKNRESRNPKERPKRNVLSDIEFLDPPLIELSLHILVSRKIPEGAQIVQDFNTALEKLEKEGVIANIKKSSLSQSP